MLKAEEKAVRWMENHIDSLFFAAVTALALAVRYAGRDFVSGDMRSFLLPWLRAMRDGGGLAALQSQVGDYNLLYQTFLALVSYSKGQDLYLVKALSVVFDFVLAIASACMVTEMTGGRRFGRKFLAMYTVVLSLPTVVLNGAYWGQCDSIYAAFVILSMLSLYRERYVRAFLFLGLALACKLQAIFILPFMVSYYFCTRRFSIAHFGIAVLAFWASGIVAYLYGREIWAAFSIYFTQAGEYKQMYLNVASFWVLVGNDYAEMHTLAIGLTLMLFALGLYSLLKMRRKLGDPLSQLQAAAWYLWVCVLFLPAMHERYTYLVDIVLVLLSFLDRKYARYALISCVLSAMTYGKYMFGSGELDKLLVLLYVAAFAHYTYTIARPASAVAAPQKEENHAEHTNSDDCGTLL